MIHFNITFIVQAANFLLTYLVLRSVLFSPVIVRIIHKKEGLNQLEEQITANQLNIEILSQEKSNQLELFQRNVRVHYAFSSLKIQVAPEKREDQTDQEELLNKSNIKKTILKQVLNVE